VLATLMDGECSLADPHHLIAAEDWPLLQARRSNPETARFVMVNGKKAPNFTPALGSLESPEFGATLLIAVENLGRGTQSISLAGPGIEGTGHLQFDELHPDVAESTRRMDLRISPWCRPVVDYTSRIVAIPRTTQVKLTTGVR